MAAQTPESLFCCLFGTGKGSGAAFLFLVLGFFGVAVCLCFRRSKLIRGLEANDKDLRAEPNHGYNIKIG